MTVTAFTKEQQAEIDKYILAYSKQDPRKRVEYKMGQRRYDAAQNNLESCMVDHNSYLDVGCGRGEMLDYGKMFCRFNPVMGTEVVTELLGPTVRFAPAWDLPFVDDQFDLVTMYDVIEHLLPQDTLPTLGELQRVASKTIFFTANNRPDQWHGLDMHINRRPYQEWHQLFLDYFNGKVTWLPKERNISETWRIDL